MKIGPPHQFAAGPAPGFIKCSICDQNFQPGEWITDREEAPDPTGLVAMLRKGGITSPINVIDCVHWRCLGGKVDPFGVPVIGTLADERINQIRASAVGNDDPETVALCDMALRTSHIGGYTDPLGVAVYAVQHYQGDEWHLTWAAYIERDLKKFHAVERYYSAAQITALLYSIAGDVDHAIKGLGDATPNILWSVQKMLHAMVDPQTKKSPAPPRGDAVKPNPNRYVSAAM